VQPFHLHSYRGRRSDGCNFGQLFDRRDQLCAGRQLVESLGTNGVGASHGSLRHVRAGGTALQTVNVYIENHGGSSAAAITYPHWTTCGVIATSFTTGSCHSFYPLSLWQANVVPGNTISWLGPSVYLQSRFNSIMGGMTAASSGYALINPTAGTCPSWPDSYMTAFESFASSYGAYIEYDQFDTYFNLQQNTIGLAVILNNTGYNRRSCLAGQIAHMVASGATGGSSTTTKWTLTP